jgi:gluconolactonase
MITSLLLQLVIAGIADDAVTNTPSIRGIGPAGPTKEAATGLVFTEGPVAGPNGSLYFTDPPRQMIYQLNADGTRRVVLEKSRMCNGLDINAAGHLVACQGASGMIVSIDPASGNVSTIADGYRDKRFNQPNDLVLDAEGGVYFTDPMYGVPKMPQQTMGLYYVSPKKVVTQLARELELPNGIGISPDGKTLYVITIRNRELLAFPIEHPGKLRSPNLFASLETSGDGMTVDRKGNVYVTQPDLKAIDVFDSSGQKLGRLNFPGKPANCCFGGKDGKTLFATARKIVYAMPMFASGIVREWPAP